MRTAYEILGISPTATLVEIREAYRTKALAHHPDRNPDQDAREMTLITEAYRALGDGDARLQYDFKIVEDDPRVGDPSLLRILPVEGSGLAMFSKSFRELFYQKKRVYQRKPAAVVKAPATACLLPLACDLYVLGKKKHPDVFSYIRAKSVMSAGETFSPSRWTLNPPNMVTFFRKFLAGQMIGDKLINRLQSIQSNIQMLKSQHVPLNDIQFYETLVAIMKMTGALEMAPEQCLAQVMPYLQDITRYAQQVISKNPLPVVMLFQDKYFRALTAQAMHAEWQSTQLPASDDARRLYQQYTEKPFSESDIKRFDEKSSLKNLINSQKQLGKTEALACVRSLYRLECGIDRVKGNDSFAFQEKAMLILDWLPTLAAEFPQKFIVNLLVRAGAYVLRSAHFSRETISEAEKKAKEALALTIFQQATPLIEKFRPDMKLYFNTKILGYILQCQFDHFALRSQVNDCQKTIKALVDFYPIVSSRCTNTSMLIGPDAAVNLFRQFLLNLSTQASQQTLDHTSTVVHYHAYVAALKGYYDPTENEALGEMLRKKLMGSLLEEQGWTEEHVQRNLVRSNARRSKRAIMRALRYNNERNSLKSVAGFTLSYMTGAVTFTVEKETGNDNEHSLLSLPLLKQILGEGVDSFVFSLDPPSIGDKRYHPFYYMRQLPQSTENTLAQRMAFEADYLIKQMASNVYVDHKPPFEMKPFDTFFSHLPQQLLAIPQALHHAREASDGFARFWIQADEVPRLQICDQRHSTLKILFGQTAMTLRTSRIHQNARGEWVDVPGDYEGWHFYRLTKAQQEVFEQDRGVVSVPAIIFFDGTVYLLEDYDRLMVRDLRLFNTLNLSKLFDLPITPSGKIARTDEYADFLYEETQKITQATGHSDHFSARYHFARAFTRHYDEFAVYFPILAQLKEMHRLMSQILTMKTLVSQEEKAVSACREEIRGKERWRDEQVSHGEASYQSNKSVLIEAREAFLDQHKAFDYKKIYRSALDGLNRMWHANEPYYRAVTTRRELVSYVDQTASVTHTWGAHPGVDTQGRSQLAARVASGMPGPTYRTVTDDPNPEICRAVLKMLEETFPFLENKRDYIEPFRKGRTGYIARSVAKQLEQRFLTNMLESARQSFPGFSMPDVEALMSGKRPNVEKLFDDLLGTSFETLDKKQRAGITHLKSRVANEVRAIQSKISTHERVASQLNRLLLPHKQTVSAKLTEAEQRSKCLWVPAAMRMGKAFGGVKLTGNTQGVEPGSQAATDLEATWQHATCVEAGAEEIIAKHTVAAASGGSGDGSPPGSPDGYASDASSDDGEGSQGDPEEDASGSCIPEVFSYDYPGGEILPDYPLAELGSSDGEFIFVVLSDGTILLARKNACKEGATYADLAQGRDLLTAGELELIGGDIVSTVLPRERNPYNICGEAAYLHALTCFEGIGISMVPFCKEAGFVFKNRYKDGFVKGLRTIKLTDLKRSRYKTGKFLYLITAKGEFRAVIDSGNMANHINMAKGEGVVAAGDFRMRESFVEEITNKSEAFPGASEAARAVTYNAFEKGGISVARNAYRGVDCLGRDFSNSEGARGVAPDWVGYTKDSQGRSYSPEERKVVFQILRVLRRYTGGEELGRVRERIGAAWSEIRDDHDGESRNAPPLSTLPASEESAVIRETMDRYIASLK